MSLEDIGRAAEMHRLRVEEGWTLREIAARYEISRERVRQLVNRYVYVTAGCPVDGKAISEIAVRVRAEKDLAAAHAQAAVILAARREGDEPVAIARQLGLRTRSVRAVIASHVEL